MALWSKPDAAKDVLRKQERRNKLVRMCVQAAEQTDLARGAHAEALRNKATLSDRNQDRIARGDDILDGAVEEEAVRKTALAFAERERYQGAIKRQLRDAERELDAAIAQQKHAQAREVAQKLSASAKVFVDLVGEFRTHLPDAMPLLLGAAELMHAVIRDCDAFARGPVAPATQAAPVRVLAADDLDRCQTCRHKQSNHWASGRCDGCDRSCLAFLAQTTSSPPSMTVPVKFVAPFHGGRSTGLRQLAAMGVGEVADYEPYVADWLVNDLKVAQRVAPIETAPVPDQAA